MSRRRERNCMGGEVLRSHGYGCRTTRSNTRAFLLAFFYRYGSLPC